jgi:probable phosphoglycerate mutase
MGAERLTTIFVRHGESVFNHLNLAQGHADVPGLTTKGREQSEQAASSLVGCGADLVVTSDLVRARETALIIARALEVPLVSDPRLRERNMGAAEGQPVGEAAARTLGIVDGLVVDAGKAPAGGETLRDLSDRVRATIEDLYRLHAPGTIVVVTHGGFVRMARRWAGGGDLVGMPWSEVDNVAIWGASWRPGGNRMDHGWLEAQDLAVEVQLGDQALAQGLGPAETVGLALEAQVGVADSPLGQRGHH